MTERSVTLHLKREDEIHPEISGNKWRKLRYHLEDACQKGVVGLLTFGGAFSNHIAATAAVAKLAQIRSIGVIRGDRIEPLNPTLSLAKEQGMELHFVSRSEYRTSKSQLAQDIDPYSEFHHIPEGGADLLGIKGCEEILTEADRTGSDIIACSAGTGATAAGLCRALGAGQDLRVYPALKGDFLKGEISKLCRSTNIDRVFVSNEYHFGGYAKTSPVLFQFMRDFFKITGIRTDPIYTGKMLFGLFEDIRNGTIKKGSRILAIHTGGLQGLKGIELREGIRIFEQ